VAPSQRCSPLAFPRLFALYLDISFLEALSGTLIELPASNSEGGPPHVVSRSPKASGLFIVFHSRPLRYVKEWKWPPVVSMVNRRCHSLPSRAVCICLVTYHGGPSSLCALSPRPFHPRELCCRGRRIRVPAEPIFEARAFPPCRIWLGARFFRPSDFPPLHVNATVNACTDAIDFLFRSRDSRLTRTVRTCPRKTPDRFSHGRPRKLSARYPGLAPFLLLRTSRLIRQFLTLPGVVHH